MIIEIEKLYNNLHRITLSDSQSTTVTTVLDRRYMIELAFELMKYAIEYDKTDCCT